MVVIKVTLGFVFFIFLSASALAQEQSSNRKKTPIYAGTCVPFFTAICFQAGYHFTEDIGLQFEYHPNNYFETGDAIGLGFCDGGNSQCYGQDGIEEYSNLDVRTFVLAGRYYVWNGFYIVGRLAHQGGSTREIKFDVRDRTIGNTVYEDLSLEIETELEDLNAPVLGLGFHYFFDFGLGVATGGYFSGATKSLKKATIKANQTIAADDLASLEEAIENDAESEAFGIAALLAVTYSF